MEPDAAHAAANDGKLPLGDLPTGGYFGWAVIPVAGTWNADFTVDESISAQDIRFELTPSGEPLRGVLMQDRKPVAGALVVDGYIPHQACGRLLEDMGPQMLSIGKESPVCLDFTREGGSFSLGVHNSANPFITVVRADGRAYHVEKISVSRRGTDLRDHPKDCLVQGVVVDRNGIPVSGVAVNLTTSMGGEHAGQFSMPRPWELALNMTDRNGRFEIHGVRPGAYVASASRVSDTSGGRKFQVYLDSLTIVQVTPSDPEGLRLVATEPE